MTRSLHALALAVLAAGCAVGPSYHPEEAVPPATKVGTAQLERQRGRLLRFAGGGPGG